VAQQEAAGIDMAEARVEEAVKCNGTTN